MNMPVMIQDQTISGAMPLRLGFLGADRDARACMASLGCAPYAEISAFAETAACDAMAALSLAPRAFRTFDLEALLKRNINGLVINSSSASNAEHALCALARSLPVLSLQPIGRCADELRAVLEAARSLGQRIEIDFPYRLGDRQRELRERLRNAPSGVIETIRIDAYLAMPAENEAAYRHQEAQFWHHLVDLALWLQDRPCLPRLQWLPLTDSKREAIMEAADGMLVEIAVHLHTAPSHGELVCVTVEGALEERGLRLSRGKINTLLPSLPAGSQWPQMLTSQMSASGWVQRIAEGEGFDENSLGMIEIAECVDQIVGKR
ncbi:hypothetical protein ACQ3G6_08265 [Allorhizobium undicola]|uniref:hypothetical protein n=1 Tax=Allorhizobium undicola TaxID=78527 RepID=UPI000489F5BE|nr:hypothetical protein [Allorhizobium undicola]